MDIAYVEMGLISIFLCLIVRHQQTMNQEAIFGSEAFVRIIWLTILVLFLDTWSWMMLHGMLYQNYWLHSIVLCIYAISHTWLPMELLQYCVEYRNGSSVKTYNWLIRLPFVIAAVMYLVNLYHPFVFRILEDGSYERMPFYPTATVWSMFYIAACVSVIVSIYRRSSSKERVTSYHLLVFSVIGLIGSSLGVLFDGFAIWPVIALDLVYLYLNVQSKREQELDILAFRDSLTGLRNAMAYRSYVSEMEKRMQKEPADYAVIVFDVNKLKYTNDHYGHDIGDRLIAASGRLICTTFQHSPVFRTGGDEFVAILEGEDFIHRGKLLELFDHRLQKASIRVSDGELRVSIARGMMVCLNGQNITYQEIYRKADQAMYQDKMMIKVK